MSIKNQQTIRKLIKDELSKQHTIGVAQGAWAMCQVILDMTADETKTNEQKLKKIADFCKKCTKNYASQEDIQDEG